MNSMLVLLIALALLALLAFFLPTIIAFRMQHRLRWTVLLVNLGVGWTILPWIFLMYALIYLGSRRSPPPHSI